MPKRSAKKSWPALPIPASGQQASLFQRRDTAGKEGAFRLRGACHKRRHEGLRLVPPGQGRAYGRRWGAGTRTPKAAASRSATRSWPREKLAKAVRTARARIPRPDRTRRLQEGDRPAGETVSGMLDKFVERYVKKEAKLRSAD